VFSSLIQSFCSNQSAWLNHLKANDVALYTFVLCGWGPAVVDEDLSSGAEHGEQIAGEISVLVVAGEELGSVSDFCNTRVDTLSICDPTMR
jgi:uncharacterized protein (DUF486 family)